MACDSENYQLEFMCELNIVDFIRNEKNAIQNLNFVRKNNFKSWIKMKTNKAQAKADWYSYKENERKSTVNYNSIN